MRVSTRNLSFVLLFVILAGGLLAACAPSPASGGGQPISTGPMKDMPADVQSAPVTVQQAYQFAVANPDTMKQIPCYCGCGGIGHTSNYACYVSGTDASGKITYDTHALGCSICVDITQDVMRLQKEGKGVADIRSYVDGKYAKYGPSNIRQ